MKVRKLKQITYSFFSYILTFLSLLTIYTYIINSLLRNSYIFELNNYYTGLLLSGCIISLLTTIFFYRPLERFVE